MSNRKYYAAESAHGSATSWGFNNDWLVYVFDKKISRDQWVMHRKNLSTIAILRSDVTKTATNINISLGGDNAPTPFTSDFWCIDPIDSDDIDANSGDVTPVGVISTADNSSCADPQPFFKPSFFL